MNRVMKTILTLIAMIPALSYGQCTATENLTTTYGHNNGQDGIMFDVVSNGFNAIQINCIESNWDAGGAISYEVYIKSGSCVGFANNPAVWNLHSSGSVLSAGDGNPTPIALDSIIGIDCGDTVGIYLTNTGGANPNANYTNGTFLGMVYSFNADISILQGYGKSYPFGFTFNPRVFNGTIHYNTVECGGLPVELTKFESECGLLKWETESELNNDYFLVEESVDMVNWETTGIVNGSGTTNETKSYELNVTARGLMYYRLTQVDINGDYEVFKSISMNCQQQAVNIVGYYNLLGQSVSPDEKGVLLVLYSDGSTSKVIK
tara:strand:+ start:1449 stop:2408 length:960 start_codon:yes stop_codon:yes gene_type:complete